MGEPARSARRLAALACWPGAGRRATTSASKARGVPSRASTVIAQAQSSATSSVSASRTASPRMAHIPSVPLISASPSLAPRAIGSIPAAARALAAL